MKGTNISKSPAPRKKYPSTLSIRLSQEERKELETLANGRPLGEYAKDVLFTEERQVLRTVGLQIQNQKLFGQALGLLGQSGISETLHDVMRAIQSGSLPFNDDAANKIFNAIDGVLNLRDVFIEGVGIKALRRDIHGLSRISESLHYLVRIINTGSLSIKESAANKILKAIEVILCWLDAFIQDLNDKALQDDPEDLDLAA